MVLDWRCTLDGFNLKVIPCNQWLFPSDLLIGKTNITVCQVSNACVHLLWLYVVNRGALFLAHWCAFVFGIQFGSDRLQVCEPFVDWFWSKLLKCSENQIWTLCVCISKDDANNWASRGKSMRQRERDIQEFISIGEVVSVVCSVLANVCHISCCLKPKQRNLLGTMMMHQLLAMQP